MSQLEILTFPNPRLRQVAKPVTQVDDRVQRHIDDMFETMYAAPGIGLAAIQVGIPLRLVVIDVSEQHDQPLCLINPEILAREGEEEMDEGCLSVPGFYETVRRAERVRVRALDRDGQPFELETDGLLAVCIQHEIDHLDGKLFVDYLSSLKRQRIRKKLEKDEKQRKPEQPEHRRAVI
ncbi:MAG: peptide deformylase [Gammaproteobacteria bacterium]|jgi:peptide deformylase|nr:peptide deformylase [Candidatus Thioaporhodococcus sediminis]TNF53497.1 MAG: peptide deformylase [Gammaproteobacteria bacterium]